MDVSNPEIAFAGTTTRLLVDSGRRLVEIIRLGDPELGSSDERLLASYPKDTPPVTAPANPTVAK